MKNLSLSLFLSFLFFSCVENTASTSIITTPPTTVEVSSALVFKKERKIELWSSESPKQLVKIVEQVDFPFTTFGNYNASVDSIPNILNFIEKKTNYKPLKIIVLPNDPRPNGVLEPCFACSFQTASIYANLEMNLKEYPLVLE